MGLQRFAVRLWSRAVSQLDDAQVSRTGGRSKLRCWPFERSHRPFHSFFIEFGTLAIPDRCDSGRLTDNWGVLTPWEIAVWVWTSWSAANVLLALALIACEHGDLELAELLIARADETFDAIARKTTEAEAD